jgi:hypothetical protein
MTDLEAPIALTESARRAVCVHEAAHAVIHSLAGSFIYTLAVAPVGDSGSWEWPGRKGGVMRDLWGACEPSDVFALGFLRWDEEAWGYAVDKDGWEHYRSVQRNMRLGQRMVGELYRVIRGAVCGALAGPIADAIYSGDEPYLEAPNEPDEDLTRAEAMCLMLPHWGEYEYHAAETERLLRDTAIWARVLSLAEALEKAGVLSQDEELMKRLPKKLPNWPRSPRTSPNWKSRAAMIAELRTKPQPT